MQTDRLKLLLENSAAAGSKAPLTPQCLDAEAVFCLLDRPEDVRDEDLQHLATCGYCQRAIILARRHHDIVQATWSAEYEHGDLDDAHSVTVQRIADTPPRSRVKRLQQWFSDHPFVFGLAAVLVVAVGLHGWMTLSRAPHAVMVASTTFGSIHGEFVLGDVARSEEPAKKEYQVAVELESEAYVTWFYLDFDRQLKLPGDQEARAMLFPAGIRRYVVTVTKDPPGSQWIGAVASDKAFDVFALRDELQLAVDALPPGSPFGTLIAHLEQLLRDRPGFAVAGKRFEIPAIAEP